MASAILWFRRDLRLDDNPALQAAMASCDRLVPLYIYAPDAEGGWHEGAAGKWWLHHSLAALDARLRRLGSRLIIRQGEPLTVLRELLHACQASSLHWNRRYEPALIVRDRMIKQALREQGCSVESHNGALLNEPWQLLKADGTPYKVFTPYYNAVLRQRFDLSLAAAPSSMPPLPEGVAGQSLAALGLLPRIGWDGGLQESWQPGEHGAQQQLQQFIEHALQDYLPRRDQPASNGSSRLSPHLHFGEISPRRIVALLEQAGAVSRSAGLLQQIEGYVRQIIWREFSHLLLYHFPHTVDSPLDARFAHFPWAPDYAENLAAWQRGATGIPLVDAGMRELWHSGWMHNRVRMIAASFLTKNLLIPWQEGARWFWDTLVDADLANNTLGWQWVAGCGADAAPYFRIFNPVRQGEKFDPQGDYVRRWLPELATVPDKYVHQPWQAPQPPENYPPPLVDLKASRQRALDAFAALRSAN